MASEPQSKVDEEAIRKLIREQARRISWSADQSADWEGYKQAFLSTAVMIASARPAKTQSVDEFVDRMKGLSRGSLRSFEEEALSGDVRIFGNVAVALVAGQALENGNELNRDVSAYLLVKENGCWRIAAQAWDKERPDQAIPAAMLPGR